MSNWGIRPGQAIPPEKLKERARALFKELVFWNLVLTNTMPKREAKNRMIELRLEIQEQLDILIPGWAED